MMNKNDEEAKTMAESDIFDHLALTGALNFDHIYDAAKNWNQDRFVEYLGHPVLIGSVYTPGEGKRDHSDKQFVFPFLTPKESRTVRSSFIIGRSLQEAHLIIPDPSILNKQVVVEIRQRGIFVKNLSDESRLLINDEETTEEWTEIYDGDGLRLGRYLFRLLKAGSLYQLFNELTDQSEEVEEAEKESGDDNEQVLTAPTRSRSSLTPSFSRHQTIRNEILEKPCQDQELLLKVMDKLSFFDAFTPYQKRRLLTLNAQVVRYDAGNYVIREGEVGSHLFILLKGSTQVLQSGKTTPIREMGAGEMFGEVAYLMPEKRTVSVLAKSEVIVLMLGKNRLAFMGVDIRDRIQTAIVEKLLFRLADQSRELSNYHKTNYYPGKIYNSDCLETERGTPLTPDVNRARDLLKSVDFFAPFSPYEVMEIAKLTTHIRCYPVGHTVIQQGDRERSLFILLKGEINIIRHQGKRNIVIAKIPAGAFFGETSFLTGSERSASVISTDNSVVLTINPVLLEAVGMDIREKIRRHLIFGLIGRMMEQTKEIVKLRSFLPGY
ncbi:MAG: cyclic nucleotide-binding domain-containing protein [Magnetococcales bacterium]|nr:cyclic nucleotide-binding domain-containing protein [Magnetococcales bacterium]